MPTTHQLQLPRIARPCAAPTVDLPTFAAWCGESAATVREWCEADRLVVGAEKIPHSWSIGLGQYRDEVRIPSHYLDREARAEETSLETVAGQLFRRCPHISPAIRAAHRHVTGVQFQLALSCGPDLVASLLRAGELTLYTERTQERGPGATPLLRWDGVLQFLTRRALPID